MLLIRGAFIFGGLGRVRELGAKGHGMSREGLSDAKLAAGKANLSALVHDSGPVALWVGHLRKRAGKRAAAGLVVAAWNAHFPVVGGKRLMGALQVVRRAPPVEGRLALRERLVASLPEHFFLKAAMKALGFALSLGVVRATVHHIDAETKEPRIEPCVQRAPESLGGRYAPGQTVVTQDAPRQAVRRKTSLKPLFDRVPLLVSTAHDSRRWLANREWSSTIVRAWQRFPSVSGK